ncbi:phospholipase A2-like [Tubulanus polymorphus]|uniref:phospholipase A2-like n=1 Tax=Tubulanus polymorphus TaxID=672921 RepID=UPI003DA391B6
MVIRGSGLFVCILVALSTGSDGHSLTKRRLDSFDEMINRLLGRSAGDFENYGNWCGLGGEGKPVDPIDECCMHHDNCYKESRTGTCRSHINILKLPYFLKYEFEVEDKVIKCLDDETDVCPYTVCQCDRQVTNCFAENIHHYNETNKDQDLATTFVDDLIKTYEQLKNIHLSDIYGLLGFGGYYVEESFE